MLKRDESLLRAALIGYQQKLAELDGAIAAIIARIDGHGVISPAMASQPARKRKRFSAAARKHMAAAQKKRWAAYRKQNAA